MADDWIALWANPWQEASFEGWVGASLCLANCKTEITPRCICDILMIHLVLCAISLMYTIFPVLCVYTVQPRVLIFDVKHYIWGRAVRCCVLRAKVYSVPPIYIKLLRTEVFFRAQVWWAKIWARRRVCWISGFHPEIICCFGLCCIAICGRLTKAKKRVSLDVPHNMQFIYKAKCVYTCSALVAWDQGA